jgi:hypothetical protein
MQSMSKTVYVTKKVKGEQHLRSRLISYILLGPTKRLTIYSIALYTVCANGHASSVSRV